MEFFRRWGERFTGSLKSSLSIALLARAEEKSSRLSSDLRRDYDEFTAMVQASLLGGTDSLFAHNLNRKGLSLISKFRDKIEWLLYANDFDKALEYIQEATTVSIISGAVHHEKELNIMKDEVLREKDAAERLIKDTQKIADILSEDPDDEGNVLLALRMARDSVDAAYAVMSGFSMNKGVCLKRWQDQLINTNTGIISIMDSKLSQQYKQEYKARCGIPCKEPNIKGRGWLVHYKPGKTFSVINPDYRAALGLPKEITLDEVEASLKDFGVHNENVSRMLWESLKR